MLSRVKNLLDFIFLKKQFVRPIIAFKRAGILRAVSGVLSTFREEENWRI